MFQTYAGEEFPRTYTLAQCRAALSVRKAVRALARDGSKANETKVQKAKQKFDALRAGA